MEEVIDVYSAPFNKSETSAVRCSQTFIFPFLFKIIYSKFCFFSGKFGMKFLSLFRETEM